MSGRKFLTVLAGLVFVYTSIEGIIDAQAISAIISMVFISYFQKERKENQ